MKKAFILMADIIDSRNKEGKLIIRELKAIVKTINNRHKAEFLSPATITLGDEFQAIVKTLGGATDIILSIEELIISRNPGFQLRYIVEYGTIDTRINSKVAYEMLGAGLTQAREHLEATKKLTDGRVLFFLPQEQPALFMNNLFFVLTSVIDKWKAKDYFLIKAFLSVKIYSMVAAKLKVDRSQIWKREKTLMMKEYFAIKDSIRYACQLAYK